MFYVKARINDQIEIKIDLYDDEIFTQCPGCGIEEKIDTEILRDIFENNGDFSSTSVYCENCSNAGVVTK